jgi:hypothetical protein
VSIAGAPRCTLPSHSGLWQIEPLPDWATMPDGRHIRDAKPGELSALARRIGAEGVTADMGYIHVAQRYVAHLRAMYDRAGREAVSRFLEGVKL